MHEIEANADSSGDAPGSVEELHEAYCAALRAAGTEAARGTADHEWRTGLDAGLPALAAPPDPPLPSPRPVPPA